MSHSHPEPLGESRKLRGLIEKEADASDRDLTLTAPLIEAFTNNGFFHLMVPEDFGGLECDPGTLLEVFDELAYADGSVGWTLMANAAATAYVSYLDPGVAAEMVKGRPESVTAGQFSPFAKVNRKNGGFEVSGHFQFGSGSPHASYVGGAGFVTDADGTVETAADGLPLYMCFFVPQSGIKFKGNWDVMGLRGTGSFDYEVLLQEVAAESTFPLFHYEVKTGGSLYGMGPTCLAGIGHAGWGLGVARRALDEIAQIADGGRGRMGSALLKEQQVFQREYGQKALALRSVRLLTHDVFGQCIERIEKGQPMEKKHVDEIFSSTAYLTEVALDCAQFAYRCAGSQGLRNPSLVQRCFRDLFTGGQHLYVDQKGYETVAQHKLGLG